MTGAVLDFPTARAFKPLLAPARYLGARGGRGSAKSWFFASRVVEELVARKCDIVCIREIQDSLDESVKKLIEETIARYSLGQYFDIQRSVIYGPHGGKCIFRGMQEFNAGNIKSLEGYDVAWVEEASALSRRSLDLLRPTIRKEGSQIWFSWNPENEDDPVEEFFRAENRPGNAIVIDVNYWDNPWFPAVLREEMELDRKRDPDKYQHVWCGGYRLMSDALVLKNWVVEEFESPRNVTYRLGADWGYAVDPTVFLRCWIDGKRICIDYEAGMVGCEIENLPELARQIPEAEKWWMTADSSRPETIAYMRSHGFPRINGAQKGKESVEEGIEWLKNFDLVIHKRCTGLIRECKRYSWKVDKATEKVLPVLVDKDNHFIDALRYAVEGVRRSEKAKANMIPTISRSEPEIAGGWMR